MNELKPINQIRLFGLENNFLELSQFYKKKTFQINYY